MSRTLPTKMPNELKPLAMKALRAGWVIEQHTHLVWRAPGPRGGCVRTPVSSTHYSLAKQIRGKLRKAGLILE